MQKIGIIGFGNMGEALGAGLVAQHPGLNLTVFEKVPELALKAQKTYGAQLVDNLRDLAEASEIIIIAIKPQDIPSMLVELRPFAAKKSFISIAAGLKTSLFQEKLDTDQVIRFMPNLAAKVGKSLVGIAHGNGVSPIFEKAAIEIAAAIGTPAVMPEKLIAAITGVSGSGIAYVFHFIHALAMGGVREGFPYAKALEYALATVEGAVELLKLTGEHPIAFESKVTSPAGTTVEGVRALENSDFTAAVMEAVSAASRRASELEG